MSAERRRTEDLERLLAEGHRLVLLPPGHRTYLFNYGPWLVALIEMTTKAEQALRLTAAESDEENIAGAILGIADYLHGGAR